MRTFLRNHLGTFAVSLVTAAVVASAPAIAATVTNAERVDGFSAVGCHKGVSQRAGKLVATCGNGYLPNNIIRRAPNSALLQGRPASAFYASGSKVADADKLDGKDSTAFATGVNGKATDSDLLDGKDSTAFATGVNGKATDADKLDGLDSTAFLQGSATSTRTFSCAGSQFYPTNNGADYQTSGSLRFTADSGTGFRCSVDLPNGATATSAQFSVQDSSATGHVDCALVRTNLATSIGTETTMASVATTAAGNSGASRITDSSVANPGIDNASFAYYLSCVVTGTTNTTGIYGAEVNYTVSNSAG